VLSGPHLGFRCDLLLQLEHAVPVVLSLDHILEQLLLPHPLVQPSVIIKVNNMINLELYDRLVLNVYLI